MTEPSVPVENKKAGIFEDFVDVITSPSQVFERRQDGKFGLHLLIITAVCVALFFLFKNAMEPIMDAEFSRNAAKMMEKNPNLNEEQMSAMRKMGGTFAGIGFAIIFPITVLIVGLVLWLAGKLFDSTASIKQSMQIATLAQVPVVIALILGGIQAMLLPADKLNSMFSVNLGPARFFDPDTTNAGLLGLLGRIDLPGIWVIVIMGIGLSVIGKIERPKAWVAAAIAWIGAMLPFMIPALISG